MAVPKPFTPVKAVCGILASDEAAFRMAEEGMTRLLGSVDARSPRLLFDRTDYYAPEMGEGLKREFVSFERLIEPERLADLKLAGNALEAEIRTRLASDRRPVNIDPGYLTKAALIMATAKDFSHRIPLASGIYAHLEFLFTRTGIRRLDWTYPDYDQEGYRDFFIAVRRNYVAFLKGLEAGA
ncbi:MAG: DUF4416 family protein [Acidobacteriota bacterium]|nr:DUF4416 family protein [Acidobacteriota bacterium]